MTGPRDGRVITFCSYKGGTGRTMALASTAWILAANGKRVLAVDWDLEAPGLHRFFHPFLDPKALSATPGVINIIQDYAWAATASTQRPDDWHLAYAQVELHAVSIRPDRFDLHFPEGVLLDFLSAGRQDRAYSAAVASLAQLLRAFGRRHLPQGTQGQHEGDVRLRADRQPHRSVGQRRHLHHGDARRPGGLLHPQRPGPEGGCGGRPQCRGGLPAAPDAGPAGADAHRRGREGKGSTPVARWPGCGSRGCPRGWTAGR